MSFFKRTIFRKESVKRSSSYPVPITPITPITTISNDIEEYEINCTPCIQQEAAGIRVQKILHKMIKDKRDGYIRDSDEHKEWSLTLKRLLEMKNSSFQSYKTTRDLFQKTISLCDQIALEYDEKIQALNEVLQGISIDENRSVKSELEDERSIVGTEKKKLDNLQEKLNNIQNNLEKIQKNLSKSHLTTKKRNKLQEQYELSIKKEKDLQKQIQKQQKKYQQIQKDYRTNTIAIYEQCQEKELNRLSKIPNGLKEFLQALNIDSTPLEEKIQKYDPKKDLTSWEKNHFSSTFKQTPV